MLNLIAALDLVLAVHHILKNTKIKMICAINELSQLSLTNMVKESLSRK